jgi:hypothetical protein
VTRVVTINTLWQKPLASALTATRERGAPAFGPHPCSETMLPLARSFGWLVGAFHKPEK